MQERLKTTYPGKGAFHNSMEERTLVAQWFSSIWTNSPFSWTYNAIFQKKKMERVIN